VTDAPTVGDDAVLDSIGAILASAMLPTAPAAEAASATPVVPAEPAAPPVPPVPSAPVLPTAPPEFARSLAEPRVVQPPVIEQPAPVEAPVVAPPAATESEPDADGDEDGGPSRGRLLAEWIGIVGLALIVAVLVKVLVISSFAIPSESMHPTLQKGDRVLVNRLAYKAHDIRRGDVIVFERPPNSPIDGPDAPKDLIKRVIGLPGDTVATHDGSVWVNGQRLEEPYVARGIESMGLEEGVKVPANHVWVMGDNRTNSADSRVFGPLSQQLVIGRAFARVWPVGRIGFL
jgi:signal peptidase I